MGKFCECMPRQSSEAKADLLHCGVLPRRLTDLIRSLAWFRFNRISSAQPETLKRSTSLFLLSEGSVNASSSLT